ncbi:receptor-like protein EIX2 [Arachis hypogaea]|uniref:receptor-like protein EIX2 n=1 Tax=Arachis hypogaea TaxID=3818 RepID=UPI003B21BE2D
MASPYATQSLLLILFIILTTFLHFSLCMVKRLNMTCNEKERNALLSFKHGLSDPSNRLSSWSNEKDCCRWLGVRCDNITGRVVGLNLSTPLNSPYMELSGEISPSLLELESLISLDLSLNYFVHTQIPSFFGSMKGLRYLDLSLSGFMGLIPYQLGNLSNLQHLNLGYNYALQIDLRSNFLQGEVPEMLSRIQNLQSLVLQRNQLSGELPDSLGKLEHLEVLDLSNNTITGPIPSSLANLSSLRTLNLGHNQLNGTIPKSFGYLKNLQVLNLASNSLTGGMPESLGILSNLVTLDLSSNLLEGPMNELNFLKLSKLKELRMSSTDLFFSVNSSWVTPFQLEYALMSSCGVGPKFPTWLKRQSSLRVLTMSKSGISDKAPIWFWKWTLQLEFLDLSNNEISGDLSNVFLNSSIINLSSNLFKGLLPSVSANVEVLNIANNSISGPISPFFCERMNGNYTNKLAVLDVSNNRLSGDLGQCWMNWQALMHLNLGTNKLSGEIPNSIGYLSGLESLLLDDNAFSGSVPSTMQNCSMLKFIDMGDNQLSDTLPAWIWEMQSLMVLRLRSNKFKGSITQNMCQLSSLIVLDLANNSLSGTIPNCLDSLKAMAGEDDFYANPLKYYYGFDFNYDNYKESLVLVPKGDELEYRDNLILVRMIDLSSNKLSGAIPTELSKLSALRFLNLSRNYLSGEIPKDMGKMKLLESLDLSLNQIMGEIPQSLSDLSFLSFLNLSYNNLSGMIPTSTQLQSFEALSYTGNPELCGPPLTSNCSSGQELLGAGSVEHDDGIFFDTSDFYKAMGVGFAAGFWGICSVIFFNRTFRHAYFRVLNHLDDLIYVSIVLKIRRLIAKL